MKTASETDVKSELAFCSGLLIEKTNSKAHVANSRHYLFHCDYPQDSHEASDQLATRKKLRNALSMSAEKIKMQFENEQSILSTRSGSRDKHCHSALHSTLVRLSKDSFITQDRNEHFG